MTTKQKCLKTLNVFPLAIGMSVVLAACGGSSSVPVNASITASALNAMLGNLSTAAGLSSRETLASFDASYADAGYTLAMLVADLAANAEALKTVPDFSLFPGGTLSNVVIDGCDIKNVCTMTATLTNSDADVTAVNFSTKVKFSGDSYLLLGDQAAS